MRNKIWKLLIKTKEAIKKIMVNLSIYDTIKG